MTDYVIKRGGWHYYFRRVPANLRPYDPRNHIRASLKTQDREEARKRALVMNDAVEAFWREIIRNPARRPAETAYKAAVAKARTFGFVYRSLDEIAEGSLPELADRLRAVQAAPAADREATAAAVLGTVPRPALRVSGMLDVYWPLVSDRLVGKADDFVRKWKNPRLRAVSNFITAVGDKAFGDITRRDILDFRRWWLDKISEEELNPDTANKDLIHLKDVIRAVARDQEVDFDIRAMFYETSLKSVKTPRVPYAAVFVQNEILKAGALSGLNVDAQAIVYYMADTGARVNEIVGLLPEEIILDGDIPYIDIRPNAKRSLKTRQSRRQIPLVGAALHAARLLPQGITRYSIADSASGLINQYFENNKLKPSAEHTLYSLRHTFKDRLRDAGAPDELKDNLMGHASATPEYGRGYTLAAKYDWLKKIAFKIG